MTFLHCVLRGPADGGEGAWETYSAPISVYAGGRTRQEAEANWRAAAAFHFDDEWPQIDVVVHLEREIADGIYARTAFDQRAYERIEGAGVLRAALTVPAQLRQLDRSAEYAATGDIVCAVCVPEDRMDWVSSQMTASESILVGVATVANMFWWTALSGHQAISERKAAGTLGELGLTGPEATVSDLIRSESVSPPRRRARRGLRHPRAAQYQLMRGGRRLVAASG